MGNDLYGMMMTLANRGIGKALGGEGNPESRAVALILTAVDQLATAGQLDQSLRTGIDKAIQAVKDVIEGKVDDGRKQEQGGEREQKDEGPRQKEQKKKVSTSPEIVDGDEEREEGEDDG